MTSSTQLTLGDWSTHYWSAEVGKKCRKAVVFIDGPSAECLHWCGGLALLEKCDPVAVRDFSPFESAPANCKKAVFIISSPVLGEVETTLKCIIKSSNLEYCVVVTSCHHAVDSFSKQPVRDFSAGDDKSSYNRLEEDLLLWMGNVNFTSEVFYRPLYLVSPSPKLFLIPRFRRLTSLLAPDMVACLNIWKNMHPNHPPPVGQRGQIDWALLPLELQVSVRHLMSNLHTMLSGLNMREEIWSVGPLSQLLCDQLESWGPARARKKVATERVSLVVVDRMMDLPALYGGDSLLARMVETLPRLRGHATDVGIDLGRLMGVMGGEDVLAPAGMASPGLNPEVEAGEMEALVFQSEKECLALLHRHLTEASPKKKAEGGKKFVTASTLEASLRDFDMDYEAIMTNLSTVSLCQGAVQCLASDENSRRSRMMAMAGQLARAMADGGDEVLADITGYVRARVDHCLSLEDLLLLLVHCYNIAGPHHNFHREDEERLQSVFGEAVLADGRHGVLGPVLTELCDRATAPGGHLDEVVAHSVTNNIWRRLVALQEARSCLQNYQTLCDRSHGYTGLLSQLVKDIYSDDRREVEDMVHHGGGLGAMLRSGFGWLGSTAKPHPRENPWIILFVVGGVTPWEVKELQEAVRGTESRLTVAGTRILAPHDTLDMLLVNNSLLTD